jgi:hypothetical protein
MLPRRRLAPSQDEMAGTLMIPAPAGVIAESEHMGAALTIFWRVDDHSSSAIWSTAGSRPGRCSASDTEANADVTFAASGFMLKDAARPTARSSAGRRRRQRLIGASAAKRFIAEFTRAVRPAGGTPDALGHRDGAQAVILACETGLALAR